ncbi:MAG: Transposase IS200 like protein [Pelotomaculum sp. PtaB.Bin013]|uniref:Transposase n=1 Tax=Pelotomaculum isophthalicicum JI TaxID=947010 RepID=A0A9X4H612_9FIRM|nr:transposase [Pelotomaculum isophthalicicum]MDF9408837.1 transposase [Pelotomaculum isophthalicicum JI]OPX89776.1 MAG: Transposase IS200 like protein [Pelotomaculum sp. PtaB.Bin013]
MARQARERCESRVYHIVMRGINRQDIFCDEDDYQRFLITIERVKTDKFEVYGYCLMSNHVHLLIHEKSEEIPQIMKRIGTSYAWWYNLKYQRTGHVFQGRYASECVEDDGYLLTVIRYIHNNPVKAGMVRKPEDYCWSSIQAYYGRHENPICLTDVGFILGIFAEERAEAIRRFREHMKIEAQETCLDDKIKQRKTDSEVKAEIESMLNGESVMILRTIEKRKRNEILRRIKVVEGATQRQIARVTGLNQSIVFKA